MRAEPAVEPADNADIRRPSLEDQRQSARSAGDISMPQDRWSYLFGLNGHCIGHLLPILNGNIYK